MEMVARGAADATKFFMGAPCKRGHSGKRYVGGRECVACIAARKAIWRALPGKRRMKADAARLYKYGMFPGEYNFMLAGQQYRCAICDTDDPGCHRTWLVDHCHATGEVRGLLCHHCNVGLGRFKDSPAHLSAAIEYLNAA